MAPKKRQRGSTSSSAQPNVDQWLWNDQAKRRFAEMNKSNFFAGAFVKFEEFSPYYIQEIANTSGLHSLLSYSDNNVKINHLLVKLFLANMGLDHHVPHNTVDCIWTWVCGVKIYLPLQRLGEILKCPTVGTELEQIDVDLDLNARDEVSHLFLSDDIEVLQSSQLRPQARIIHRALIRSVTPRTGSYQEVRKINFQALYGIYSRQTINWGRYILEGFMDVVNRRKFKTIHYGAYIMRILSAYSVPFPDSDFSTISELGARTTGLMGLERRPQSLAHITYQEWIANRNQNRPQPRQQQQEVHEVEEEGEASGEVEIVPPETTSKNAYHILSQNQAKLESRMIKDRKRTEKRFNSIRGFLNKIWERLGCSGASSSQAFDPAPFQWTSSSGNNEEELGDTSEEF